MTTLWVCASCIKQKLSDSGIFVFLEHSSTSSLPWHRVGSKWLPHDQAATSSNFLTFPPFPPFPEEAPLRRCCCVLLSMVHSCSLSNHPKCSWLFLGICIARSTWIHHDLPSTLSRLAWSDRSQRPPHLHNFMSSGSSCLNFVPYSLSMSGLPASKRDTAPPDVARPSL
jgi:hypothetical protein